MIGPTERNKSALAVGGNMHIDGRDLFRAKTGRQESNRADHRQCCDIDDVDQQLAGIGGKREPARPGVDEDTLDYLVLFHIDHVNEVGGFRRYEDEPAVGRGSPC